MAMTINTKGALVAIAHVLLASVLSVALGGCVIKGPEIKVKPPIEIKAEPAGKHCPPGQAKKGNC